MLDEQAEIAHDLNLAGFARGPAISEERTSRLRDLVVPLAAGAQRGGARNLLARSAAVRGLVEELRHVATRALGAQAFSVRGLLFDKVPGANWKVIWHQDLTIAVRDRRDVEGFGPWSRKDGVPHVQAPSSVLERMVALRIHLDSCGPTNGPLRVIPGSHRSGRYSASQIDELRRTAPSEELHAEAGGVLLMKPLVLHASTMALLPAHRRVIHLEFASDDLPGGLEWFERV